METKGRAAGKWCSDACYFRMKSRVIKGSFHGQMQHCRQCGVEIGLYSGKGPTLKWCTEHHPSAKKDYPERDCKHCGKPFKPINEHHAYCSRDCRPKKGWSFDRAKHRAKRDPRSSVAWRQVRLQVIAEETHCGLCGLEVDKTLPYPHPGSPTVDHIDPLLDRGHEWDGMLDRSNLRLAHRGCQVLQGGWIGSNQRRMNLGKAPRKEPAGYYDHTRLIRNEHRQLERGAQQQLPW
jgi:hypothetical protein